MFSADPNDIGTAFITIFFIYLHIRYGIYEDIGMIIIEDCADSQLESSPLDLYPRALDIIRLDKNGHIHLFPLGGAVPFFFFS